MLYYLADTDLDRLVKQVISAAHARADNERESNVLIALCEAGIVPESCRDVIEADDRAQRAFDAAKAIRTHHTNISEGLEALRPIFDDPVVAPGTHEIALHGDEKLVLTIN